MSDLLIAGIAVENCAYSFDDLFSFAVPGSLREAVCLGKRVLVPFGRANALRQGFVLELRTAQPEENGENLKSIFSVLDDEPLLNEETVRLALYLRETTFCTYFGAAKALLPGGMCLRTEKVYSLRPDVDMDTLSDEEKRVADVLSRARGGLRESAVLKKLGLKDAAVLTDLVRRCVLESKTDALGGVGELNVKMVRLTDEQPDYRKITLKQRNVIELLTEPEAASVKEVCYYTGVTPAVIHTLVKNGFCELFDAPVYRNPVRASALPSPNVKLSEEQTRAYETLWDAYESGKPQTALLFGVTGSGKTNVYLSLIEKVLADRKNVIVLVPEISLTSQTISIFEARFGERIAVLHSALSMGERRDEFFRIKRGEANVVIGTRSAVFAPLDNIGAIIIDEEQEHTYKSEMSPRYDAKNVARFRCNYHNALLVLASATPSVETYAKAKSGKYLFCELTQRYGNAVLPEVTVVDTSDRTVTNRYSALSIPMVQELRASLERGEQSILLVNRRGYNTFVACQECKHVMTCPKCSISMTYHAANHRLMCHYCGYSVEYTDTCPVCGNKNIRYSGFGTQRVEQELQSVLPSARVLRMDADTTSAKNAHEKALSAFAQKQFDILIGTQMVAKGLDFPNVTFVGIVAADNELYDDDFRSAEYCFDLITQVTGRAGRAETPGKAMIQTHAPDNEILKIAARQDYKTFFEQEIALRKALSYPPFCDICKISVAGEDENQTFLAAKEFFSQLVNMNDQSFGLHMVILGPLPPKIAKLNNQFRQKIIIKCVNSAEFRELIRLTLKTVLSDRRFRNTTLYAVMNPESSS